MSVRSSSGEFGAQSRHSFLKGHECSRSAAASFDYEPLPELSAHSGSHACDFDCVFTNIYKGLSHLCGQNLPGGFLPVGSKALT